MNAVSESTGMHPHDFQEACRSPSIHRSQSGIHRMIRSPQDNRSSVIPYRVSSGALNYHDDTCLEAYGVCRLSAYFTYFNTDGKRSDGRSNHGI